MRASNLIILSATLFGLLLGGCGGGGPKEEPQNITLNFAADIEGMTWWNHHTSTSTAIGLFLVGDANDNEAMRSYVGFDTSSLAGAQIVSATLTLGQVTSPGWGAPFADLGDCIVEHVNLGPNIDDSDFGSPPVSGHTAVLSSLDGHGARTCDVTAAVANDVVSGRGRSEYRIRFQTYTDNNGDGDAIGLGDAAGTVPSVPVPVLRVTYQR